MIGLVGCSTKEVKPMVKEEVQINTAILSVTEKASNLTGKVLTHHYEYSNLAVGDSVYGGFATIRVKEITETYIVLKTENVIVPNEDGTFNMFDKSLTEVKLQVGESIDLVTQSLDSGATLNIQYGF